jgi:hypothetical protein
MSETHHKRRQRTIHVSPSFRWIENAHILLWLIKDFCWAMEWKTGGVIMIFPTVSVAFYLLWKSRKVKAEAYHNVAVCFWILANSTWMLGEFNDMDLRPFAAGLFGCGLLVLGVYYAVYFKKDRQAYNME